MERVYNFSAGPATLPLPVLQHAQKEFLSLPGVGMSVLEISHRSPTFDQILENTQSRLRNLLKLPDDYHILFTQGGASLQFSMLAMNFLPDTQSAAYLNLGSWSSKAISEANKLGSTEVIWDGTPDGFCRMPTNAEICDALGDRDYAYVHMTSNETIEGIAFQSDPDIGSKPLVCDASSDIMSRPLNMQNYAMLYAGAQKNMGPAGVTLVLLKDTFFKQVKKQNLPSMLDYGHYIEKNSMYNTPPVFSIYMLGLVAEWLIEQGGLEGIYQHNKKQADALYQCIDQSNGFYRGHAQSDSRSLMNVTFRLASPELEKQFLAEAENYQLSGLKGHRSVGGIRASIYNAFPDAGIDALISFMQAFQAKC